MALPVWAALAAVATPVVHPAECGLDAFCAIREANNSWTCEYEPGNCMDEEHVMLHMRVNHSTTADVDACVSDGHCSTGEKCVARQCHEVPDNDRDKYQVAAATCASLGPEFAASVTTVDGCVHARCVGGNPGPLSAEDLHAYSCALCAGYAARMWGSTVTITDDLACKVEPRLYVNEDAYVLREDYAPNATLYPLHVALDAGTEVTVEGTVAENNDTVFMRVQTQNGTAAFVPWGLLAPQTAAEPDPDSCTAIYASMFIARERTYELEPVTGTDESYLLVGIFPDAIEQQIMPHTITVPLRDSAGVPYSSGGQPPQLRPWDRNLQATVRSPQHDPQNELAFLWRFITPVTEFGQPHVFGMLEVTTHDGTVLPQAIPKELCSIIPPYTRGGVLYQPDPYCCKEGQRTLDRCTSPAAHTYGLNHVYMRQDHVCGHLSTVQNPLLGSNTRKLPPYADFLVVPQRWTADTRGGATEDSVKDVDRRPWNNNRACRPLPDKDWCLHRDYGVLSADGKCVFRGERQAMTLKDICTENGTLIYDCISTVDPNYVSSTSTTPAVQIDRQRCNGTECFLNNTGCRHRTYVGETYTANTSWTVQLPRAMLSNKDCGNLCDISQKCVAYAHLQGDTACTHYYDGASATEGTPVQKKHVAENGCFNIQYDADVTAALAVATHKWSVNLNTCYDLCEHHNCTDLVYEGRTNVCGLMDGAGAQVLAGGDGLYAQRNEGCTCPDIPVEPATTTFPSTVTLKGFGGEVAFFGTATGAGKKACGASPEWVCPLFRSCNEEDDASCQQFNLTADLSGTALYYDPTNLPQCTGSQAKRPPATCGQADALVDVATTTVPTVAAAAAARARLPQVHTTAPAGDTPVVEIVISSVIGGCGLVLIAAGFYYRKRLAEGA